MQETTPTQSQAERERLRRSYRALLAASILLAAIGAPLLMQGAVVFAQCLTGMQTPGSGSPLYGLAVFVLSATPLALAGYAWRRTRRCQDALDDE